TSAPVYYGATAVRRLLTWDLVTPAVECALTAVVEAPKDEKPSVFAVQPKRSFTSTGGPSGFLLTMPAFVGNYSTETSPEPHSTLACKLVTSFKGNPCQDPPLPSVLAHVLIFDPKTGVLKAILEGTDLTTWRTVAASLLATKYLYFRRFGGEDKEMQREITVAIVGCGVQGRLHAHAFWQNFRVKKMNLYNRTIAKATQLKDEFDSEAVEVFASSDDACHGADVICVATYASEPLVQLKALRSEGCVHINAVGAGEVHFGEVASSVYERAKVYVDCFANAKAELAGLPAAITAEVGEVILGKATYPQQQDITIFQSMG
ncbi:hypothetical protein KR018_004210, partial [Drosophila ironensis]